MRYGSNHEICIKNRLTLRSIVLLVDRVGMVCKFGSGCMENTEKETYLIEDDSSITLKVHKRKNGCIHIKCIRWMNDIKPRLFNEIHTYILYKKR